jgi:hypothetical protein
MPWLLGLRQTEAPEAPGVEQVTDGMGGRECCHGQRQYLYHSVTRGQPDGILRTEEAQVNEFQKQFGLMSLHGYALVLAITAVLVHSLAATYHYERMMEARR